MLVEVARLLRGLQRDRVPCERLYRVCSRLWETERVLRPERVEPVERVERVLPQSERALRLEQVGRIGLQGAPASLHIEHMGHMCLPSAPAGLHTEHVGHIGLPGAPAGLHIEHSACGAPRSGVGHMRLPGAPAGLQKNTWDTVASRAACVSCVDALRRPFARSLRETDVSHVFHV